MAFVVDSLRERRCDIWIDDRWILSHYLKKLNGCQIKDLIEAEAISFGSVSYALAFREEERALVDQINAAVQFYENMPSYQEIEERLTGVGESCPLDVLSDAGRISTEEMSGTLYLFGGVWLASLLLSLANYLRCSALLHHPCSEAHEAPEGSLGKTGDPLTLATEGEMLRMIIHKVEAMETAAAAAAAAESKRSGGSGGEEADDSVLQQLMAKVLHKVEAIDTRDRGMGITRVSRVCT